MSAAEVDRLERAGRLAEARDRAIADAAASGDAERAGILAKASELALYVDGPERARTLAQEACAAARASGNPAAVAVAELSLARVHLREHTDRALDDAEAALARVGDDDRDEIAATRLKLSAMVAARRGDARTALERFAAGYARAEGNPGLRARVLLAWAVQLRNWGLYDDARRKAERSLEIRHQLEDHYGAALCWGTLAFVHQRRGDHARERDALAADLREVERIGGTGDLPALHGRMAGALVGLGKYAGAWAEAERAIAGENQRLGLAGVDDAAATRTHAYAWREMARVCLAQSRPDDGAALAGRAAATFDRLRDGYGGALSRLTLADLETARAERAEPGADARAAAALAAARPVFVRLGAVPEAAETVLIQARLDALVGSAARAAERIVHQVLPMLEQAGLGHSELARRARETAGVLDPAAARELAVSRAAMLRSLAAVMVEDEAQPATVIAARVAGQAGARRFARAAGDAGAVIVWCDSIRAAAIVLGAGQAGRADGLEQALAGLTLARAEGTIDLEHTWPAPPRACGPALDEALARLATEGG